LEWARKIAPRRTILIHLSHVYDHGTVQADLPPGFELAYDGMTLEEE
jgi:phosphoribosyl 1,2-cyclic phosphate phosphodiesterase